MIGQEAEHAMEQAAMTADYYAWKATFAFKKIFNVDRVPCDQTAATFIAAFMHTAAADFDTWVRYNSVERMAAASIYHVKEEGYDALQGHEGP